MSPTTERTLDALIDTVDPFWPTMAEWARAATNDVTILERDRARAEASLVALQVTTRSPLGAITLETGGVLFDRGWVRLLGGGGPGVEGDVARWNGLGASPLRRPMPGMLIVAYDVVGGFFAINGGAFGEGSRNVFYFAPDSLRWEDLGREYSDFVHFLCVGELATFYADYRWPSWERDVAHVPFDKVFSIVPPLWSVEGKAVDAQLRKAVPALEAFEMQLEVARQLVDVVEGERVHLRVGDNGGNENRGDG